MSDLTLQNLKAIAIATAVETASKDAVELQHQHWSDSDNKLSKKKGAYGNLKQKLSKTHVSVATGKNIHRMKVILRMNNAISVSRKDTLRELV